MPDFTTAQVVAMPGHVDDRRWLQLTAMQFPFLQVGTATIEFVDTSVPVFGNLFVHPQMRRFGIAKALTRYALRWARNRRLPLHLHVRPDNLEATALYEALGFCFTGELTDEGSRWMVGFGEEVASE